MEKIERKIDIYEKPKLKKIKEISPEVFLKTATHLSDSPCGCSG